MWPHSSRRVIQRELPAALVEVEAVDACAEGTSLRRAHLRDLAGDLLQQRCTVSAALECIHSAVLVPLDHSADLRAWCWQWEGNHPSTWSAITDEEIEMLTREEARKWVG